MKEKTLIILLCVIMVLGVSGCENKQNKFCIGDKSNIQVSQEDILLYIKEGTLTNTGATLILKNNSMLDYYYGNPYEIEIKKNEEWYKINVSLDFTLPSFVIKAGDLKEIQLNWEDGYGKLTSGTYRIIKNIDYEIGNQIFKSFYIAAEFNIE